MKRHLWKLLLLAPFCFAPLAAADETAPKKKKDPAADASPSDVADVAARARTLPPNTPYKEWFNDGTWYHYVLSCCDPAQEEESELWDYGVLTVDAPIQTVSCAAERANADLDVDYFFRDEPGHGSHSGGRTIHPLAFRGSNKAAAEGTWTSGRARPYSAEEEGEERYVRFNIDGNIEGIGSRTFLLFEVAAPFGAVGDPVSEGKSYFAIELNPDLEFDKPFYSRVPTVKLQTNARAVRSEKKTGGPGPLFSARLHFTKRDDFPGRLGVRNLKIPVYVVTQGGFAGWGDPNSN